MVTSSFLCAPPVVGGDVRLKEAFALSPSERFQENHLSNYTLAAVGRLAAVLVQEEGSTRPGRDGIIRVCGS